MFSVLKPHRWKLALLLIAANLGLLLHLACGELKSVSEWVWLDIIGEGGSALLALIWLGLVLKSRPAGRVTQYLALGLSCIFFPGGSTASTNSSACLTASPGITGWSQGPCRWA